MKKLFSVLISIVLIICVFSGCQKMESYSFEAAQSDVNQSAAVVTFNCAAPWGSLKNGTLSSSRVKRFAQYMNDVHPDSIGTQEMNSDWLEKLKNLMSDYDSYGVQRGGDDSEKKSEMNAVFWLKDKYECIEQDTFWLSETPDTQSKYEGAGCYRICSYVVLQNRETKAVYIHMNTHLDNASDDAREFGAEVVMEKAKELLQKYNNIPLVLTGDFNDTVDSAPYKVITETLTDSYYTNKSLVQPRKNTYTDWGSLEDEQTPIDFIFTNSSTSDYQVLDDLTNGYVSDHYGVYSVIILTA